MLQSSADSFNRHVSLPDANDGVPTPTQIGILRGIAFSLGDLSINEWFKFGVSMPPVAVCLNDYVADSGVNYKFGFYDRIRLIGYTEVVQYLKHFLFEFSGRVFLEFSVTLKYFADYIGAPPNLFALPAKPRFRSWLFGWIVGAQIFRSRAVNCCSIRIGVQNDSEPVCAVSDLCVFAPWQFSEQPFRTYSGIFSNDDFIFWFRPENMIATVLFAIFAFSVSLMSAFWASVKKQTFFVDFFGTAFAANVLLAVVHIATDGACLLLCSLQFDFGRVCGCAGARTKAYFFDLRQKFLGAPFAYLGAGNPSHEIASNKDTLPALSSRCLGDTEHGKVYANHIRLCCVLQQDYCVSYRLDTCSIAHMSNQCNEFPPEQAGEWLGTRRR